MTGTSLTYASQAYEECGRWEAYRWTPRVSDLGKRARLELVGGGDKVDAREHLERVEPLWVVGGVLGRLRVCVVCLGFNM